MRTRESRPPARLGRAAMLLAALSTVLASCGTGRPAASAPMRTAGPATSPSAARPRPPVRAPASAGGQHADGYALPAPAALMPFGGPAPGQGSWRPAGRLVRGMRAVYQTTLVPPGGTKPAGIAWMDTRLLAARLYSGSRSPGGGPYLYTAPVAPAQAATLVAAFNGGFLMKDAEGGYYTQGRVIYPLRRGAASLVIYADGSIAIGAWGRDVRMTPDVVSVRQNLVLLVAGRHPTAQAASADWRQWGRTCAAASCLPTVPGIDHQWRSGLGVTADGALVYAAGPALDPLQLAELLVRAGAVRGMQLDINPYWPVFVSYDPSAGRLAAPSNGRKLLAFTVQGPRTFFEGWWARDFVTMSARPAPVRPAR